MRGWGEKKKEEEEEAVGQQTEAATGLYCLQVTNHNKAVINSAIKPVWSHIVCPLITMQTQRLLQVIQTDTA